MLVFDITNRESFTHIHKWFQQASEVKFSYNVYVCDKNLVNFSVVICACGFY